MAKVVLENLDDDEYEHPFDHKTLAALEAIPGLDTLVSKVYWGLGLDNLYRISISSSCLKVTERNYPDIYHLFTEAKEILNVPEPVELYILQNPQVNAFTTGVRHPMVVLHSSIIDLLTPEELQSVIGHELGHYKSGHVLYYTLADFLIRAGSFAGELTLGIGNLIALGIQVPLLHWQQMSELTADRAGLLACQDLDTAIRSDIKLAGIPYSRKQQVNQEEWIRQVKEFEGLDAELLKKLIKYFVLLNPLGGATHPFSVMRTQYLMDWVESGGYQKVISRETAGSPATGTAVTCRKCGYESRKARNFCPKCGESMKGMKPAGDAAAKCPKCGRVMAEDEKFCAQCGTRRR
jgi:Zn-dependent protease with chaperone function/RNA polymerase subunit RPABC4/transcription elongation factor Spt4